MQTRITELFKIKYPIMLSGMSWISMPEIVAAVSNAGGLGILGTGVLNADETREAIREIRTLTDKPFGVNVVLNYPGAVENAKIALDENVPVINFSLGKGDWIVKAAHDYGGKVIATVSNNKHAKRAQDYGCDVLVVTGNEAAGHCGDVTSLVLIPAIADTVSIPIIAAGGFADGRGLVAALALGADGIAMGTRFMNTMESPLHDDYKKLSLIKTEDDTIDGIYFDGMGSRLMKTTAALKAHRKGIFGLPNFPKAFVKSRRTVKIFHIAYAKFVLGIFLSGWKKSKQLAYFATSLPSMEAGIVKGDIKTGVLPAGQTIGLLYDIPTVAELIERIAQDAVNIRKKLSNNV